MRSNVADNTVFSDGSKYMKADLHLHTKSDKEFKCAILDDTNFAEKYVNELKEKGIKIGAITNHNKFEYDEFQLLNKVATKEDIFLLPGIELSVNDGKRGIHALIIFAPEDGEKNNGNATSTIETFLTTAFGINPRFDNDDNPVHCNLNLDATIEKLDELKCHYFIILAHTDTNCGFFKELKGGRIMYFLKKGYFRKNIVACQNTNGSSQSTFLTDWVKKVVSEKGKNKNSFIPAFISASDPKNIEQVGARYSNIKIGDYSFDAVKFSLMNPELRIRDENPHVDYPYIKRLHVKTDKAMSEIDICLNPDMNNLIGIRGSGKSAFLEAIRYVLERDAKVDRDYKNSLMEYAIGSGGKIILEIMASGQEYRIERITGERPKVYRDDEYIPDLHPSAMFPVVYYGQKDIQEHSMNSELQIELIDQFIGEKRLTIHEQIREKEDELKDIIKKSYDLRKKIKKTDAYKAKKASLEDKISVFQKLEIADKLQKEGNFKKDEVVFERLADFIKTSKDDISSFKVNIGNIFSPVSTISSKENPDLFAELEKQLLTLKSTWLRQIDGMEKEGTVTFVELEKLKGKFAEARDSVEEEIAKIKREINISEVSPDDFGRLVKELEQVQVAISEIEKYDRIIQELEKTKQRLYSELQALWHAQWSERELKKEEINASQTVIQLEIDYKGNKKSYAGFMKEIFRGTGLRMDKLDKLSNIFSDNIELFNSLENRSTFQDIGFTDNEWMKFKDRFLEQEDVLCLYRVPDLIEIRYDGKPIRKLSLGQRASSLLLLLLSQENTPVIMDQPEDDLDNQTVYEGLIKKIIELKGKRQIIFATHNSNIPVLGDCEQVVVFDNENEKIVAESGSIDKSPIQKNIIDIMEGGKEAFTKRKEIYYQWIP